MFVAGPAQTRTQEKPSRYCPYSTSDLRGAKAGKSGSRFEIPEVNRGAGDAGQQPKPEPSFPMRHRLRHEKERKVNPQASNPWESVKLLNKASAQAKPKLRGGGQRVWVTKRPHTMQAPGQTTASPRPAPRVRAAQGKKSEAPSAETPSAWRPWKIPLCQKEVKPKRSQATDENRQHHLDARRPNVSQGAKDKEQLREKCARFLLLLEEIGEGQTPFLRFRDERHHLPIVQHRNRNGVAKDKKDQIQHRHRCRAKGQHRPEQGTPRGCLGLR